MQYNVMKGVSFMKRLIRLLLKIIAIPFIVVLTVGVAFMYFLFGISEWICTAAAVILAAMGIITIVMDGITFNGVAMVVMGFLISPFGIRGVIEWFIDLLDRLNCSLKDFVTS